MSKKTLFFLIILVAVVAISLLVVRSGWLLPTQGLAGLTNGGWGFLSLVIFVSALVDSINPCAISVLLITLAFLFSLGRNRRNVLTSAGLYILGIYLIYLAIGLGLVRVLTLFGTPHLFTRIGAVIVILWGLTELTSSLWPAFPIKLRIPEFSKTGIAKVMNRSTRPAFFGLGVLIGLTEFPCTGGPYLFVLGLLQEHTTFKVGMIYLLFYNLIFVLPLIILSLVAADPVLLQKFDRWRQTDAKVFGLAGSIMMVALGLLILYL